MCGERFHLNISSCSSNIILMHGSKVLQNVMIDVNLIQGVAGWLRLTVRPSCSFWIATLLLHHFHWSCTTTSHYRWLDSFPWRLGTHWLQANLGKRCEHSCVLIEDFLTSNQIRNESGLYKYAGQRVQHSESQVHAIYNMEKLKLLLYII